MVISGIPSSDVFPFSQHKLGEGGPKGRMREWRCSLAGGGDDYSKNVKKVF